MGETGINMAKKKLEAKMPLDLCHSTTYLLYGMQLNIFGYQQGLDLNKFELAYIWSKKKSKMHYALKAVHFTLYFRASKYYAELASIRGVK